MTQAFNLSQLANKVNSSGQLDGSTGLTGTITSTGLSITNDASISGLTVGKGGSAIVANTAVGASALNSNTTGGHNNAFGSSALYANTTGNYNTALGWTALNANTTGSSNVAIGEQALVFNTTASNNTAVGYQAGYSGTTANASAYFGYKAGYSVTTGGAGGGNQTFLGYSSGRLTTGYYNTFVGSFAGDLITTGNKNTILGGYDGNTGGLDIRTTSNNIVLSDGDGNPRGIAVGARWSFGGTSDDCVNAYSTGSSNANSLFCGFKSTTYNGNGGTLCFNVTANGNVTNTNNSYGALSDIKLKENIVDATPKLDDLMKVHICNFNYKTEQTNKQIGVIAQELEEIFPAMVTEIADKDEEGNNAGTTTKSVKYSVFVPMLIKAIQELNAKIIALENK